MLLELVPINECVGLYQVMTQDGEMSGGSVSSPDSAVFSQLGGLLKREEEIQIQ